MSQICDSETPFEYVLVLLLKFFFVLVINRPQLFVFVILLFAGCSLWCIKADQVCGMQCHIRPSQAVHRQKPASSHVPNFVIFNFPSFAWKDAEKQIVKFDASQPHAGYWGQ